MSEMSRSRYSLAKIIILAVLSVVALYQACFMPVRPKPIHFSWVGYGPGGDVAHLVFNGGPSCDPGLWQHIYNRSRLQQLRLCSTVTGTIIGMRTEKDGDVHTFLKVDPQFDSMLNAMNRTHQKNTLIIEPVCVGTVAQADAKKACRGFHQSFPDLKVGNYVEVTGVYVLDRQHGHNELHPVTSVTKIAKK